jgi:hypothetical protein
MIIEIGTKQLKEISQEELKQIVIIEGCCLSLIYWNEPEIIRFSNKMFSDTLCLDYFSYRTEDHLKSGEYTFFFNFEDFRCHYTRNYDQKENQQGEGKSIGIETLRFLIKQGYDVPLYTKK